MADSEDTYSASSWWADSGNANADGEYTADAGTDVPGYDTSTSIPGTDKNPPGSKTDFPANSIPDAGTSAADYQQVDQFSTQAPDSLGATQRTLGGMGTTAYASLSEAVRSTPVRTLPGQVTAGDQSAERQEPLINTWSPVSIGGYLAAELAYSDASLIAALQSAGAAAGGQAALVAQTTALFNDTVRAGGSTAVGSRGTPASALASGSEYGGAPQFRCGPWFFPAVAAWAEANPVPPEQEAR